MKKLIAISFMFMVLAGVVSTAQAKGDDFGDVVKLIEQFYHVKHQGIPFLAKAGIKATTTAARIAGGPKRHLAEAGSVKVAYFEDQDFRSTSGLTGFRASIGAMLAQSWSPLILVTSPKDEEQTYIFLRQAGEKFHVLVVTLESREGCVVQVTLSPHSLAKLLKNPDEMGQTITAEATTNDED